MKIALTQQQEEDQKSFRMFVKREIVPYADQWDQDECFPIEMIQTMAHLGYLGAVVPRSKGGTGTDMITLGILHEEIGRGCSSARSLLTVHSMVTHVIHKWGNTKHKEHYLSALVNGDIIGAFAMSEQNVGSDAKSIETTATLNGNTYVLNGSKRWTTFGQNARLFLLFAQCDGKHTAFLVERDTPGLSIKAIHGMLGTRASMLAEIHLDSCVIPKENRIGGLGFGLTTIATSGLDIGRYSVACGSVGIAQACLESCLEYTSGRRQFGNYLKDYQLIQQMITNMVVDIKASRLLCFQAGYLKDKGDPNTVMESWIAKYFASIAAMRAATDAVQIHGANGCSSDYAVQRYFRDAKIMEIIEGSSQIQQMNIAQYAYQTS